VQARLGIIIGPTPEMARVLEEFDLGTVAVDFSAESLAAVFDAMTPEGVAAWKHAADAAAEPLSGERQQGRFSRIVDELLTAR